MDRKQFVRASATALERIDEGLADLDLDELDVDLAGDVLTVEFTDGTTYVINAHSAAEQIWMAAEKTAWHFDLDETSGNWVAAKSGDELLSTVSRIVGTKLGREIGL